MSKTSAKSEVNSGPNTNKVLSWLIGFIPPPKTEAGMRKRWISLSNMVRPEYLLVLGVLAWVFSKTDSEELAFWFAYKSGKTKSSALLKRSKRFLPTGFIKCVLRSRAEINVMMIREATAEAELSYY